MPVYKYNLSAFYNVQEGHYIFVFFEPNYDHSMGCLICLEYLYK